MFGLPKVMDKSEGWPNSTFSLIPKENSHSLWGNTVVFLCWCRCGFAVVHHGRSSGYLQEKDGWHVLVLCFCHFPITNRREWVTNFTKMWIAKGRVRGESNGSVFRCCHQADRHSRRLEPVVKTSFWKRKVDGETKKKTVFLPQATYDKKHFWSNKNFSVSLANSLSVL